MSTNIFTPMYKTRNYIEVVTISEDGTVTYDKDTLEKQFLDGSNDIKIIEKYKKIHEQLEKTKSNLCEEVYSFVEKTNEKLGSYKKTESDLLAKIYEWPQKFQDARTKYKNQLETAERAIDELKKKKKPVKEAEIEEKGEDYKLETKESIDKLKNQIKIIKSSLSGLKLMNFEMKSVLSSSFGVMTTKTINNAISSFVVIYNRILNQITEKEKERSFRKRMMNMVTDMKDHVYFGKSMKHRITDEKTKNGLQFWINKIKNVNETETLGVEKIEAEVMQKFGQTVDEASRALMEEQNNLLKKLNEDSDLSGDSARELLNKFLVTAEIQMEKLDKIKNVPAKLLMAAKLKICADLLKPDTKTSIWTVFGRGSQSKLLAARGLEVAGEAVPKLTTISVTCSVLATVCSKGFIALCAMSVFTAGIPLILTGFEIAISSLISISIGKLVGYGLKKGGKYIESEARGAPRELLGTNKNSTVTKNETILAEEKQKQNNE